LSQPQLNRPPDEPPRSRFGLYLWIGFLVVGGLALWQLNKLFPGERSNDDAASLIQLLIILGLVSSSVIFVRRSQVPEILRNLAIWTGIFALLAVGYAYQDSFKAVGTRVMSEIVPGYAMTSGSGEMVLTERGGHFFVTGEAGGIPIVFLIDTGASDIVFSPSDARRIGLDTASLDYTRSAMTANGVVRGAPGRLESLKIGALTLKDVPITINEAEMETSLLGMNFLRRLKSYEVRGRQLYLRW
jgi:aspartyl protease family protein